MAMIFDTVVDNVGNHLTYPDTSPHTSMILTIFVPSGCGGVYNAGDPLGLVDSLVTGNYTVNSDGSRYLGPYVGSAPAPATYVAETADYFNFTPASDNEIGLTGCFVTGQDGLPLLANNGGPTQTIALAPNSPAIGAGYAVGTFPTDQRGPGYFHTDGLFRIDLGALSFRPPRSCRRSRSTMSPSPAARPPSPPKRRTP